MKHYTVHSTTQDDTNIDLWWIKKVCVLHNLCEMFVDVRVYHFPVQTQISCKICISSFETILALAGSCCGLDSTVQAGCWSVYLVLKNLQFRCYWSSRRGEVRVRVRGERSREVFKDDPTLNSWESHRPEKCRCVFVGPAPSTLQLSPPLFRNNGVRMFPIELRLQMGDSDWKI